MLLDDAPATPALRRWLTTPAGRRELAAYRAVLARLETLHGDVEPARPVTYYCGLSTPIGRVLVAASESGLVRVSFRRSEASFRTELERGLGGDVVRSPGRTAEIVHQLRGLLPRRAADVRRLGRPARPDALPARVLMAATEVPAGRVVSYGGDIARRIGVPGREPRRRTGARAEPDPDRHPRHRVVASGGRIGGYTGGLDVKRKLLRIEGVVAATG
jgi:methylated-DNA-[protein]-cysteine S-methyltransferase